MQIVLFGLAGCFSVWVAQLITRYHIPGIVAFGTFAVSAVLFGLILTSTTYNCTQCVPHPKCRVVKVGVPFPQQVQDRDTDNFDVCIVGGEKSQLALIGNFMLGVTGLPILVMLLLRWRGRNEDSRAIAT